MRSGLRLERVTEENVRAACQLKVRPDQENLVAPIAFSLADAYTIPDIAWPRLIYDGDQLVGFIMAAFDGENPSELFHSYLWRLNIAAEHQGRGYGRFAVESLCREAIRRGYRRLTVSYSPEENGPEGFYAQLGFLPTGERHVGQLVAERTLTADGTAVSWLPAGFVHPLLVPVPGGYHLRPIRAADTSLDYPAVMGSRERLWSIFGAAWGWPAAALTYEDDRVDLARHEAEIAAHESFNYALMDDGETALFGCVYIDPPEKVGADADISWWVVDDKAGTELERDLDELVPRWIAHDWPFSKPRYIGRDLSWADWLALADAG